MVSDALQQIISFLRKSGFSMTGGELDVNVARQRFELAGQFFPPPDGTRERDVVVGGVTAVEFLPSEYDDSRVLFYLHGGAYCIGSPRSHRGLISHLALRSGARAIAPDYRLGPEHAFPAAIDDALAAYRGVIASGVDPARLVVGGDSAGGGLALALLVALRDAGDPLPACAVLLSPWTDLELSGASMTTRAALDPMLNAAAAPEAVSRYLQGANARDPLASPLYADPRGLPPMLIQVGDHEILLDDSVRFAERARAVGVDVTLDIWPEMIHVWQFFAGNVPEADEAIGKLAAFISEHTSA